MVRIEPSRFLTRATNAVVARRPKARQRGAQGRLGARMRGSAGVRARRAVGLSGKGLAWLLSRRRGSIRRTRRIYKVALSKLRCDVA